MAKHETEQKCSVNSDFPGACSSSRADENYTEVSFQDGPPLRIVSIITRLGAGGPPLNVVSLARGLSGLGYETVIATGSCSSQDGDMSYLLKADDKIHWIPRMSRSVAFTSDLLALAELVRFTRRYKPDVIHTHTAKAGVLGRIAGRIIGVPAIVHTYHGNVLHGYFSPWISWCIRKLEQLLGFFTDSLCVLSEQQHREIAETFRIARRDKVSIVPLGLNLERLAALDPPPTETEELTVGWLGRLVAIKDVPLLIEIIEQSIRLIPSIRFVIAGDGPDRPLVTAAVERFGPNRVHYAGWQRDVVPVIGQCDVLIQTSRNEGTPTALIQGMAAARPFVSTAVGGVEDMTVGSERQEDSAGWFENAVLLPPNAKAFASTLRALSLNRPLLRTMGLTARKLALSRYSEGQMLQSMNQLYRALLKSKRREVSLEPGEPASADV